MYTLEAPQSVQAGSNSKARDTQHAQKHTGAAKPDGSDAAAFRSATSSSWAAGCRSVVMRIDLLPKLHAKR